MSATTNDGAADEAELLRPEMLARLERLELVTRKIFRGRIKGERRSKRKGQSVEFADFRSYVPGDDLRFIDWNTYARLDRLFLKMFLEEEDLHFFALIDASPSMNFGEPTKLHYAKQLAAALGFTGLVRGDRVRIETLGQSPRQAGPVLRRPAKSLANARLFADDPACRKDIARRGRQEFLRAEFRQRHFGVDHRLAG